MKITSFLLFVACLHVSASGFSQDRISISGKNLSIEDVLKEISAKTDYQYVYADQEILGVHRIDISVKNETIENVLDLCFKDQPYTYHIDGKIITVKRRGSGSSSNGPGDDEKVVTAEGIVYNESGQPLSGANISLRETGKGTITNAKGEFSMTNAPVGGTLVISYTGYAPQSFKIKSSGKIQVYLVIARSELDKVVIQAYGSTTARNNTGNISTVTAEQIEKQPVVNPIQALEGQVAGLVISQTSGYASAPFTVELRGRNLIGDVPTDPLYIIDGVPLTILGLNGNVGGGSYQTGSSGFIQNGMSNPAGGQSPFFSISPSDIESITILKDADATAIYGSRGANGVVLITTKKGNAGKTDITASAYQGVSAVTKYYDLLNTRQYLEMRREAFANDQAVYGLIPGVTIPDAGVAPDLVKWDTTKNTNWQKALWGKLGMTTNGQLSVSGGDKQTTFRIGTSYDREQGILSHSGADQRAALQFNLSHRSLDQKWNFSFTTLYSTAQSNLIFTNGAVTLPPDAPPIFNKNGALNYAEWDPFYFPFGNFFQPYVSKTTFLNSQLTIGYEILKGLSVSSNLGYSINNNTQTLLNTIASQDPASSPTGTSIFGTNSGNNFIAEPKIEYKNHLGKGILDAFIGASAQGANGSGSAVIGQGYSNDALMGSISNAPSKSATDGNSRYKYAAAYGRLNYNWNNKYIINISARRDGSSRFGPGKQYGNFGAIGGAWIFSEENWVKNNLKFLSFGKLRGSYGTVGNDQIGDYGYLTRWSASNINSYLGATPSYVPLQHANPNLQWQLTKKAEAAVDFGFFKDAINIEFAVYQNRCGNQLTSIPLPTLTGFSSVSGNSQADVENSGYEVTLKAKIINNRDLTWDVNFDIGVNRNKLLSFPNIANTSYAYQLQVGKPLRLANVLHYIGVDPLTGQYVFQDFNHDGSIDYNPGPGSDLYKKDLSVKDDGGFGTNLSYKHWQISMFFHFKNYQAVAGDYSGNFPGTIGNQPTAVLNRWQKTGDKAKFARFTTQGAFSDTEFFAYSDGTYSNASFIRLQNLAISYIFSSKLISGTGFKSIKAFLRGENLLLITKYNGVDPETPGFGGLPPSKVFTGGVQIVF